MECNFKLEIINYKEIKNNRQLINDLLDHTCLNNLQENYLELLIELGYINFKNDYYDIQKDLKLITRLYPELKILVEMVSVNKEDYRKIYVYQGKIKEVKAEVIIKYEKHKPLW